MTPLSNEQLLELDFYKTSFEKTRTNLDILSAWIKLMNCGVPLTKHPSFKDVSHVAIYGYGIIGKLLKNLFDASGITVDYILDRNADKFNEDVRMIPLTKDIPKVDLIIISLPNYYHEIIDQFHRYGISGYVLIDEIISELERIYL